MKRWGTIVAALFVVGLLPPLGWPRLDLPEASASRASRTGDLRLFVAAPQSLILIDVYVTVDKMPWKEACRRALARAMKVRERAPDGSPPWWAEMDFDSLVGKQVCFQGEPWGHGHAIRSEFTVRYDKNGNGRADREEVERLARDLPGILFYGEYPHAIPGGPLCPDLFACMNSDQNGLLSSGELPLVTTRLKRRDLDFNDLLEYRECGILNPYALLMLEALNQPRYMTEPQPRILALADRDAFDERLTQFLARAYAGGSWRRSARAQYRPSPGLLLETIDANGSFEIESWEIPMIQKAASHLELEIDFPSGATATMSVRWAAPALAAHLKTSGNRLEIALAGLVLAIDSENLPPRWEACAERAQRIVKQSDKNRNGVLEGREQEEYPFEFLDDNRDGKATVAEVRAYLEREQAAAGCRISLAEAEDPLRTFAALDANLDRRLSLREMLDAPRRILSFDTNSDGSIGSDEIPCTTRITIRRGDHRLSQPAPIRPTLEDWFDRMDRNRDGDVSHREFLGSQAQFHRLDIDQDGLVSRSEASRAPK